MKGKRRRFWEGCKTFLILLLAASAVWLGWVALYSDNVGFVLPQQTPRPARQEDLSGLTLRPAAFAVTQPEGRYALLPYQDDPDAYAQLSALLAQALSDAQAPQAVSQREWQKALTGPGIFCEYLAPVPLDTLARWLSRQPNDALDGSPVSRLYVTGSALYAAGEETYCRCALTQDWTSAPGSLFGDVSPNGAQFAFENRRYAALRGDSLVLEHTPTLPVLTGETPVSVTDGAANDALSQMLQALAFHPQTNPLYTVTGGWGITDGSASLRIQSSGVLSFRQQEDDAPRYPVEEEYLDLCRSLAEETLAPFSGEAHLYLHDVSEEDGAVTVTFGYAYLGVPIRLTEDNCAARFTVENGAVTSFFLQPRRYTLSEETPPVLLPMRQAAAGVSGIRQRNLRTVYEDTRSGESISPFWAAFS